MLRCIIFNRVPTKELNILILLSVVFRKKIKELIFFKYIDRMSKHVALCVISVDFIYKRIDFIQAYRN